MQEGEKTDLKGSGCCTLGMEPGSQSTPTPHKSAIVLFLCLRIYRRDQGEWSSRPMDSLGSCLIHTGAVAKIETLVLGAERRACC